MINMVETDIMSNFTKGLSVYSVYIIGVLSLALSILPIIYVYDEPIYQKDNTNMVGLNDLTARNVIFLCSVLFGINALVVVVLKLLTSALDNKGGGLFDFEKMYASAMLAFKSDFLRTTASVLVVALFYVFFSDPREHDTGKNRDDHGALLIIPAVCAFAYKLLAENMHTNYVQKEEETLGKEMNKVSNNGAHILIAVFAFVWTFIQSGVTNNGVQLTDEVIAEGDPFQVILLLGLYILLSTIELAVEKKIGDENNLLYKVFVGVWQNTLGVRISRILIYITLPFLGAFVAKSHTQNNLIVLLTVLIAEGTQVGFVDFTRRFKDNTYVNGLRGFQVFWSAVIGIFATSTVIVDSIDNQTQIDAISPLNKTAEVFKEDKRLEASYQALYAVVLTAGVIKFIDFVISIPILSSDGIDEAPQKQKFSRFAALGVLVGSAYLWAGGATFWGLIGDNSDHKISIVWASWFFLAALATRLVDSAVNSIDDKAWDLFNYGKSKDSDPLRKVSSDNIRTYLVLGALTTALAFASRHREIFPENKCETNSSGYVTDTNEILCVNQGWAIGLIAFHLLLALVALVPMKYGTLRKGLLSTIPALRMGVSTAVICLLVVTIGQTDITSATSTIDAPDSEANNAIGALVAYLFADAFGDGFL